MTEGIFQDHWLLNFKVFAPLFDKHIKQSFWANYPDVMKRNSCFDVEYWRKQKLVVMRLLCGYHQDHAVESTNGSLVLVYKHQRGASFAVLTHAIPYYPGAWILPVLHHPAAWAMISSLVMNCLAGYYPMTHLFDRRVGPYTITFVRMAQYRDQLGPTLSLWTTTFVNG